MWLITFSNPIQDSADDEKIQIWLCPVRKRYTVGRQDANVLLSKYRTVSRKHACFHLEKFPSHTKLFIEDLGSKYGSLLNSQKLGKNVKKELKHGDMLFLGLDKEVSIQVEKLEISIVTSNLKKGLFQAFYENSKLSDYSISRNWMPECTHLMVSKILPTQKTLFALQKGIFIVGDSWLKYWLNIASQIGNLNSEDHEVTCVKYPPESEYLPELDPSVDTSLERISWEPSQKRKNLFDQISFIILEKDQEAAVKHFIENSKGMVTPAEQVNSELLESIFRSGQTPQIVTPRAKLIQDTQLVLSDGTILNLEPIAESMISQSILLGSTQIFPKYEWTEKTCEENQLKNTTADDIKQNDETKSSTRPKKLMNVCFQPLMTENSIDLQLLQQTKLPKKWRNIKNYKKFKKSSNNTSDNQNSAAIKLTESNFQIGVVSSAHESLFSRPVTDYIPKPKSRSVDLLSRDDSENTIPSDKILDFAEHDENSMSIETSPPSQRAIKSKTDLFKTPDLPGNGQKKKSALVELNRKRGLASLMEKYKKK